MSKAEAKGAAEAIAAASPDKAMEVAKTDDAIKQAKGDKPKYTGIAVLGSNPQNVLHAPWDMDDWLIYACSPHNLDTSPDSVQGRNPNARYLNGGKRIHDGGKYRVDEWFEVHVPLADATRPYQYLRALEHLDVVWMRDHEGFPLIHGARPYPEQELKARFGPFFFTSSIAFIMAKAIVDCEKMSIPTIGIWGVMQATETEYTYQRPGIQYFIQKATEAKIRVVVPENSLLFEPQKEAF